MRVEHGSLIDVFFPAGNGGFYSEQLAVDVEHVQDIVEKVLIKKGHAKTAKSYILYRAKRTDIRNARSELMDTVAEILKETDRDNANISNSPSAKMLQIASAASREYYFGCQPRILFEPCYSGRNGGGA